MYLKNAELEPKLQKYKGRVVLRGDIDQDDSGACAVFTEFGSSASQITAAKIMDVITKLPDCEGQAADAVSAYTHVKLEDAPRLPEIPKPECPDGRSLCPVWKTQLFLLSGICMVICYQDCCGNGNLKKYCLNLGEKSAELGLSFCSQETMNILVGVRGRHQNGWKEAEYGTHVLNGNANQKKPLLKNTHICLNHVFLLEQHCMVL